MEKGKDSMDINAIPSTSVEHQNDQVSESNKNISKKNPSIASTQEEHDLSKREVADLNAQNLIKDEISDASNNDRVGAGGEATFEENTTQRDSNFINNTNQKQPDVKEQTLLSSINETTLNENKSSEEDQETLTNDPTMPDIETITCPKGILRNLSEPGFNIWKLDRDGMVEHIEYMYHDLGITKAWKIPRTTLKMFLLGVRERYQDNPYHNFKHCFCVTQMAYSMLCKLRLRNVIPIDHVGALLTAAVCHDVDHPGLSNAYHCHARTPLAILYNYSSILEQHHFAVTCRILSNKERNIFRNVNNRDQILTNIRKLILATDLCHHKTISEDFNNCVSDGFSFKNSEHVMSLLKIIIKCADVSNEVRPESVAGPWVERLFAEYYEQSAREKREHLPVSSHMDPDNVNVSESQENFIRGVMLPLYRQLGKLSVDAAAYYINPLFETLTRYEMENTRNQQSQL